MLVSTAAISAKLNINAEKFEDFDEELKVMEMVDTPE